MTQLQQPESGNRRIVRLCTAVMAFLLLTAGVFFFLYRGYMQENAGLQINTAQMVLYTLGGGALIAAMGALFVKACFPTDAGRKWGVWACPLAAAGLSLALMGLAYVALGVYPVGNKSILMVDMHHQYAPLMSELRDMLLNGGDFTYSFHIGLGANFLPCFAYYLASPFNFLLLFFSEAHLAEAILVITLLKNALAAGAFAACVQYLYHKRTAAVVGVSVMYSLMLYMLAYSWNIMWLDVVALLPLVVMCFERMLREGKWLGYVLTLALALFSNYYIGFMLCVFMVLYFVVWMFREPRTLVERAKGFGYFAGGSLLGGGLVMALLLPTAIALGRTSAAGDVIPDFATNFDLFELFGRLFYGATPTIRSGNLPNLYCGVAAVLLVPIYATQRSVPLRRRVCYVVLLCLMLLSCTINLWDLLWHGLHTPNDLPYRFSFLVCFVLLLLAARVLTHLTQIAPKQILGSLTASAVYLVLWEKFGGDKAPDDKLLYINLLLLGLYALVLLLGATRRLPVRAGRMLLLTLVTVELFAATPATLDTMDGNEYFTLQENYVDNDATAATAAAIKRAQAISEKADDGFARIEYLPRSTCMDTALHHYNGITTFASSNSYYTTLFMGDLGYAINGVNSYLYHSFVAPVDSLLGVKYVVLDFKMTGHTQLKLIDSVTVGNQSRYIYENTDALPLGYFASNKIAEYAGIDYAPFDSQEALYAAIIGDVADIYTPLDFTVDNMSSSIYGSGFMKDSAVDSEVFTATVTERAQYFAFVDCRAATDISVETFDADGEMANSWSVTNYEPYIIDLGTLAENQTVKVTITADGAVSGNIYVERINPEEYAQVLARVQAGNLVVTDSSETMIRGEFIAREDGALFLTIPYDRGWTATVDGAPAETFAVDKDVLSDDGAMLAVKVPAGAHTVELRFRARGLGIGFIISCASLLAIVLLWGVPRLLRAKRARQEALVAAAAAREAQAAAQARALTRAIIDAAVPEEDFVPPEREAVPSQETAPAEAALAAQEEPVAQTPTEDEPSASDAAEDTPTE